MKAVHTPVLSQEVLQYIALYPEGIYVDATVGLGGHAQALLRHCPHASLVGIDRDADALKVCAERLKPFGKRVRLVHGDFAELRKWIKDAGHTKVDAVIFDFGVSSLQLDNAERGFSFNKAGPLDMRMDQSQIITAEDLIHSLHKDQLMNIIKKYGEERFAGRIAEAIVRERKKRRIRLTTDLVEIIKGAVPKRYQFQKIHPATRTFQAIRMEVNQEMEQLKKGLEEAAESLVVKGRMAMISFHSLEDRAVKDFIFNKARGCICSPTFPLCVCGKKPSVEIITRKSVRPEASEIRSNLRSRSARMRVIEKVA